MLYMAGINKSEQIKTLMQEANELTAIFTSTRKTARINQNSKSKLKNK